MHNHSRLGSLTGHDLTRGDCKKHTGAESHKQRGGHEEVVLGKNDTHGLSDERVYKEENETMEEDGKLIGADVLERNLSTVCLKDHTWTECKEKNSGNGYLLGGNKREHLIYTHNIFRERQEMVK